MKWPFYYLTCISFADVLEHVNKTLLIFIIQFMSQTWETGPFGCKQMWNFGTWSSGRLSWTSSYCNSTKIVTWTKLRYNLNHINRDLTVCDPDSCIHFKLPDFLLQLPDIGALDKIVQKWTELFIIHCRALSCQKVTCLKVTHFWNFLEILPEFVPKSDAF